MPTRRALKGVLHGFLGRFTSRYSAYQGYWLFGFLIPQLTTPEIKVEIDLLTGSKQPDTLGEIVAARAVEVFADQLRKASFELTNVQQAQLSIRRLAGSRERVVDHHLRDGYLVRFEVVIIADTSGAFERAEVVFIAPHDPMLERKS